MTGLTWSPAESRSRRRKILLHAFPAEGWSLCGAGARLTPIVDPSPGTPRCRRCAHAASLPPCLGCGRPTPKHLLVCRTCWSALPDALRSGRESWRRAIEAHYAARAGA